MARYYFDTDDGQRQFTDPSGIDLPNLNAAVSEAFGLLHDLVHGLMPEGHRVMTVHIRDEAGTLVYRGVMTVEGRRFPPATRP